MTSGLKSHKYEFKQFEAVGRLGDIWVQLGFFNYITIPIYKGGFEITFPRNSDNNVLFRWKSLKADGTETLPVEGKI
jgi:hypothetical protein